MTSSSLAHVNRRLKRRYYRLGRHRKKKPPDPGGGPPFAPHRKLSPRHHSRSRRHSYMPPLHNFPCHNASPSDYSSYILHRLPHFGVKAEQPFRHSPRIAPVSDEHKQSRATHRHLYYYYTSPTTTQPTTPNNSQSPPPHPHYPYHDTLCQTYGLEPSTFNETPPVSDATINTNTSPPITQHISPFATLPLLLYFWIFMMQITSKLPSFSSKHYGNYPHSSTKDACHLLPQPNFTSPGQQNIWRTTANESMPPSLSSQQHNNQTDDLSQHFTPPHFTTTTAPLPNINIKLQLSSSSSTPTMRRYIGSTALYSGKTAPSLF